MRETQHRLKSMIKTQVFNANHLVIHIVFTMYFILLPLFIGVCKGLLLVNVVTPGQIALFSCKTENSVLI